MRRPLRPPSSLRLRVLTPGRRGERQARWPRTSETHGKDPPETMRVMAMGRCVPSVLRSRKSCRVASGRAPWGFQDSDPRSAAPVSLRPGPEDFLPRVGHPTTTFHAPQSALVSSYLFKRRDGRVVFLTSAAKYYIIKFGKWLPLRKKERASNSPWRTLGL